MANSASEVEGADRTEESQEDFPGRLADPEQRSAVERRAVNLAKIHDEGLGFDVVEKGKPVDLLCMPGSRCAEGARVIHVEAKGTTSSGSSVHLTRNEVADAREAGKSWRSDLFVVSGIELRQDASGAWLARGGEAALFERWSPSDEDLTPTDFVCRLPRLSRR